MDQDKAFGEYWERSRKKLMAGGWTGQESALRDAAREVWYGCLNAQPAPAGVTAEASMDIREAARLVRTKNGWEELAGKLMVAAAELEWFRSACAEMMGCDAPGGDGCHPLKDWLKELVELRGGGKDAAAPTESLLHDLSRRGGPAGALGEAGLLFTKKGEDYNTGFTRDDYFPMGLASYAQMLWVKALRLLSFAKAPRQENYEGPRDTLLDLISYAAFGADWLRRTKAIREAQDAEHAKNAGRMRP